MQQYKTVDHFIARQVDWHNELVLLRKLMNATEMQETTKWGIPVYTINGKNVLGIGAFKAYVGIWFYQGVFLKDEKNILINAQEGKTKGMRQWRFNSINDIDQKLISDYVTEAIANQKAGKEIKPEKKPLVIPKELAELMASEHLVAEHFEKLSLSNKRDYAEYISEAKREATKHARLAKIKPMISQGIGLNDKYK